LQSLVLAALAYVFTFQGGNVQHVYYQVIIMPVIAMLVGVGIAFILKHKNLFISPVLTIPIVLGMVGFAWFISYNQVKDYYVYSDDLVKIAQFIQGVTAQNDKIVTDTVGDTTLLYLADRKGAPSVYKSLPELKNQGYAYFVTMNKEVAQTIKKETKFQVIGENEKFTLFKL
jgi:hypothetical protein